MLWTEYLSKFSAVGCRWPLYKGAAAVQFKELLSVEYSDFFHCPLVQWLSVARALKMANYIFEKPNQKCLHYFLLAIGNYSYFNRTYVWILSVSIVIRKKNHSSTFVDSPDTNVGIHVSNSNAHVCVVLSRNGKLHTYNLSKFLNVRSQFS